MRKEWFVLQVTEVTANQCGAEMNPVYIGCIFVDMKRCLPFLYLLTILCFSALGQTDSKKGCPAISVTGPAGLTAPGSESIFAVNVTGSNFEKLDYQWTVSGGNIVQGLGSPVIYVLTDPNIERADLIATVRIKDLPEGCRNESSMSIPVGYLCKLPITLDEYGRITPREEFARLENVAKQVRHYQNGRALFMIFASPTESKSSVKQRFSSIQDYLIQKQHLRSEDLIFVFAEATSSSTRIYLAPPEEIEPLTLGNEAKVNLDDLFQARAQSNNNN